MLRRQLRDPSTSSLSVQLRITEIVEMASRMRQARDRQRESLALSDSNPGKSVANIFRHRSSSKRGHELPPLLNDNKVFLIDDTDKAELFSAFFAKHLATESDPVPFVRSLSDRTLSTIDVSSDLIKKHISRLENSHCSGTDGIPNSIIKHASELNMLLSHLFSVYISKGFFPETWETSIIIPAFKSGSRSDVNNYRGVHKTASLAKLLERIIFNEILDFCLANRLLSSSQHGFLPKRSCETCHLAFLNLITSLRNEQQSVVVIYFDLSKAFDKVPHGRLLVKLEVLGIRPPLLDFIRSYLSDRYQKVMVGNSYSTPHSITSGVLQGTVLGPLLFLLYINDISTELGNSQTFIYADDLKCIYTYSKDTASVCVEKTVYSIKPIRQALPIPSIGSIVLAKITSITRRFARCDLVAVGDRPLAGPFRGMIRREDIRSTQRDRAEPSLSFRPGDLIRARVINLIGHVAGGHPSTSLPGVASPDVEPIIGSARAVAAAVTSGVDSSAASSPTCLLSTAEPELGVVLGIGRPPLSGTSSIFGSTGGLPLVPSSWTEMVCPRSMAKFPRKVAKVPNELIDILLSSSCQ
ncbi:Exosome complex component CSL4 [Sparganum proliferum]